MVSGPPLGGKGPLAANLHEALPGTVKIEVPDNLGAGPSEASDEARGGEEGLLREARRLLVRPNGSPGTVVVLCARFATPGLRARAARVASDLGVRFLLIEATSSSIRSLRRLSRMFLTAEEATARIERYRIALQTYEPVSASERRELPARPIAGVLSDLEQATARAVTAWSVLAR